jgi:phosphatidylglycerol lysyltransferase
MQTDARLRVLELVRQHGWNATAFQTLERHYSYFFAGDDACVAYVDTGGAWVAAGAPIAAPDAIPATAASFVEGARAEGRRACFAAAEDRLRLMLGSAFRSLVIGEQPVWDPREWPEVLGARRSLREQLRRARAKGVVVRLLSAAELASPSMRAQLTGVVESWLSSRTMAPMGFLVHVDPFTFPAFRRCFVAERNGDVIAFAGVIPVPARGGWFIEDLIRTREAPNGTGELLTDAVMRWTAAEGSDWVTLGLAPLAGHVTGILRAARKSTSLLYDFQGLQRYKAKLRPDAWSRIYVLYPQSQSAWRSIIDMLTAFSRGGLLRFGVRTLLRGPTAVLRVLAVLLVPWTVVLALAPVDRWFPGPIVRWGWVLFDVAVLAGLVRLIRQPSRTMVTLLAAAVSVDAVLTLFEAILWNIPRARGIADVAIIACACLAPIVAAAVLWGARSARLRD